MEESHYEDPLKLSNGTVDISVVMEDDAPDHGKLAEALLERLRKALTNPPNLWMHEESLFSRHGDYWIISYRGHAALLKSTRGLQCLAVLLSHPGREFHVSELLASFVDASIAASRVTASGRLRDAGGQLVAAGFSDADPVLDARSKGEYKHRLDDLRQELSEAEKFNDRDRAVKAQEEIHAILQHLASAVGLGGRDRTTSSKAERARSTITKRIKTAIQKIGGAIPSLGHHLTARIRTGYFFSYNPHPDRPVAWKV